MPKVERGGRFYRLSAVYASRRDDYRWSAAFARDAERRSGPLQARPMAVPDLQEDMVRKVPQAEGRPSVQEAGVP